MEQLLEFVRDKSCIDLRDHHENNVLHILLNDTDIETDVIKLVLDHGLDVNARNKFGYPPLQHAVSNPSCDPQIVRLLLERGASIDVQDNYGNSSLHHILRKADYDVIRLLIDMGADVNAVNNDGDSPLNHAVNNSKWGVFNLIPNDGQPRRTVPNIEVLQLLLDRKPDVNLKNNFGDSPLHYAVNNCDNKQDVIRLLLCRSANLCLTNHCGESALHRAINGCEVKPHVIRSLLDFGADVNAKNNYGDYPLFMGVKNPSCPRGTLKLLLDRGANVLTCSKSGEFPLRRAVQDYQRNDSALERVQLLIKYTLLSSLGFNVSQIIKSTRNFSQLLKFSTDCVLEILRMGREKVGQNRFKDMKDPHHVPVTLYEFMRGHQEVAYVVEQKEEPKSFVRRLKIAPPRIQIDYILKILHDRSFPIYHEVIASKVKREDMLQKLKTLMVYTFKKGEDPPPDDKDKIVILDCYSVFSIAEYLLNEDLINFIIAFQFAFVPPIIRFANMPRPLVLSRKRSAEVSDGCIKRLRTKKDKRKQGKVPVGEVNLSSDKLKQTCKS